MRALNVYIQWQIVAHVLPLSSAQSTSFVTSACQLGLEMLAQQQEYITLVHCLLHKPWIDSKEILLVPMWLCLQTDFVLCMQVFHHYVVYKSNESHNTAVNINKFLSPLH